MSTKSKKLLGIVIASAAIVYGLFGIYPWRDDQYDGCFVSINHQCAGPLSWVIFR